jgi:Zn-dependent peptidase ImmA (M78 family)
MNYQQMLQLFFQEEFLRRLTKSPYAENLILKGGLFIYTLTNFQSRATVAGFTLRVRKGKILYSMLKDRGIFMLNYDIKAIDQYVNKLLAEYDDPEKIYSIDPSVDILKIAKACGIKEIQYVSPEELHGEHAIFEDGVVKIDKRDTEGQRLFDIAHEVGHIVFNHIDMSVEYKVARQGTRRKPELSPQERKIEDLADHFAANLLIPIHRFQLWEAKLDKEIARVFKVEERCIQKRREEIGPETSLLTAAMTAGGIEEIVDNSVELDLDALLRETNG